MVAPKVRGWMLGRARAWPRRIRELGGRSRREHGAPRFLVPRAVARVPDATAGREASGSDAEALRSAGVFAAAGTDASVDGSKETCGFSVVPWICLRAFWT